MTEEQIEKLKELVNLCGNSIYWMDNDSPKRISKVGPDTFVENGITEPYDIGFLERGGYIALSCCDPTEFVKIEVVDLRQKAIEAEQIVETIMAG